MSAAAIIQQAQSDGLQLAITERGTVKLSGPKPAIERWTPTVRQHKPEIIQALMAANDERDHAELARLVARVCRAYDCMPEEVAEAIDTALRDFEAARETYTSLARNLGMSLQDDRPHGCQTWRDTGRGNQL